jgi:hypothetical protein
VAEHFGAEVDRACRVLLCESHGNPMARNARSSASGLFQFLDGTFRSVTGLSAPASSHPPEVQVAAAAKLWRASGWRPWVCR